MATRAGDTDPERCDTLLATDVDTTTTNAATTEPSGVSRPRRGNAALDSLPVVSRDHYEIEHPFASGGLGRISVGHDKRLDRDVAIKELRHKSDSALSRFAREIRLTAKLQHPNIVQLHEAGRWPSGDPFFAMRLVDGDSLEAAIQACTVLADHLRLLPHVVDVADAMAHAHSKRILHRDLKPGNVLVGPFGETVVIDWGLGKDLADEDDGPSGEDDLLEGVHHTRAGSVLGTPAYMPPEQAAGRSVDERADVYAIGAIMYHVLSGKAPYDEYHPGRVLEVVKQKPPIPLAVLQPRLPGDLVAIVDKAMSRRPNDRYANAGEMSAELQRYENGLLVDAHSYSFGDLVRRFVRRHSGAVAASATGIVLLVAFAAWSFDRISGERDAAQQARDAADKNAQQATAARADAEARLEQTILEAAKSALADDPTRALALLKRLGAPIAGAATIAADAEERGVATRVLEHQAENIDVLAYSADGRYLASAGLDGAVHLFDRQSGTTASWKHHEGRVPALAFIGAGTLVSGGYDGKVVAWSVADGKARVVGKQPIAVRALEVASDGRTLATVADDGVRIWHIGGSAGRHLALSTDREVFARFVPSGDRAPQRLVTGSHGGAIASWDLGSGEKTLLEGHEGPVNMLALSPAGDLAASAGADGTVRRWDLDTGKMTLLGRHLRGATAIAFLDAAQVVSGGMDGSLTLWHLADGREERIAQHRERVATIVTLGGRFIASGGWDRQIQLIDRQAPSARALHGHGNVVSALAFLPDGGELASASWDRQIRMWKSASVHRQILAHEVGVKAVAFSPDAARVASGGHDDVVRVWDVASGKRTLELAGHTDHVYRVLFSPDGKWIASSSDDRTVRLWDAESGEARVLEGHQADVEELSFSADGRFLASAGEDGAVGLWPIEGAGQLLRLHEGAVSAVVFDEKAATLVSASGDGTLVVWDVATRKSRARLTAHAGGVTSIAMAPGGSLVSSGRDKRVLVWDLEKGESRLLAELDGAERVAISPDGSRVAVASAGGEIALCALAGGPCLRLLGHEARVHALAFSQDGALLVTGSEDQTVRVWSTTTGESRPLRRHAAPVFDVALGGGRIASASGDRTIGLWALEAPPAPDELAAWLDRTSSFALPNEQPISATP